MSKIPSRGVILFGILTLTSCGPSATIDTPGRDAITQVSVINALMVGRYEGVMTIPEMLRHGDFGVGTLDHLDGEMIVLDGRAYQVRGDGSVAEIPPDRSTPFAVVTPFDVDGEFPCPKVASLSELDAQIDALVPQKNLFAAIRIDAQFASITVRSVHRQEPPYKPLAEVAKSQNVWTHADVKGTLVGIRSPVWVAGLSVPGYHWHFLSDDHKVGGHVLDCRVIEGRVRYDLCRDWRIKLDDSPGFDSADLGQDLRRELREVESSRNGGKAADH